MKSYKNISQKLKSETPKINPQFKRELGQKLFLLAKNEVDAPKKQDFILLISDFYRQMKSNFFLLPATGSLVLALIGAILLKPLNPEEILASAAENYSGEGLFHQEVFNREFKSGELVTETQEAFWVETPTGNTLHIQKDPKTGENLTVSLNLTNPYGDTQVYESKSLYQGMDLPTEPSEWLKKFEGEKTYCLKTASHENSLGQAWLALNKKDPSYYQVTGGFGENSTQEATPLALIKSLQQDIDSYELEEKTENGIKSVIFSYKDKTSNSTESYYFDPKSYELQKTLSEYADGSSFETIYLKSGFDQETNPQELFNPENYSEYDLISSSMLNTMPPFSSEGLTKAACYNYKGEPLDAEETKAILNQAPESALNEWLNQIQMIESSMTQDEIFTQEETPLIEPEFAWAAPATTHITQGYHQGHQGLDYSGENRKDQAVKAITKGVVISVQKNGGTEGYGNTIQVDHGNGIVSFYAHLGEIFVEQGQEVSAGEQLAFMGNTGAVIGQTGIHLHFEIHKNGEKVNPFLYIEKPAEF